MLRQRLAFGTRPKTLLRYLGWVSLVDVLLAPVGLVAAVAPAAFLAVIPLMALLRLFAHERNARVEQALELSAAYRRTAVLLGDVVELDDAYTGRAQPQRGRAVAGGGRHDRSRRPAAPRRRVRRAAARRRQARRAEGHHQQARPAHPVGAGADRDPHADRRGDPGQGRRARSATSGGSSARVTSAGTAAATPTAWPARRSRWWPGSCAPATPTARSPPTARTARPTPRRRRSTSCAAARARSSTRRWSTILIGIIESGAVDGARGGLPAARPPGTFGRMSDEKARGVPRPVRGAACTPRSRIAGGAPPRSGRCCVSTSAPTRAGFPSWPKRSTSGITRTSSSASRPCSGARAAAPGWWASPAARSASWSCP